MGVTSDVLYCTDWAAPTLQANVHKEVKVHQKMTVAALARQLGAPLSESPHYMQPSTDVTIVWISCHFRNRQ